MGAWLVPPAVLFSFGILAKLIVIDMALCYDGSIAIDKPICLILIRCNHAAAFATVVIAALLPCV